MNRSPVDLELELEARQTSTGLPRSVLRAVYLRGMASHGEPVVAMARVDHFIVYALTRDTRCSLDRDLVPVVRV